MAAVSATAGGVIVRPALARDPVQSGGHHDERNTDGEHGRETAGARRAHGRKRDNARGNDLSQRGVIEQEHAQQYRQQVEEVVVAGERNQDFEHDDAPSSDGAQPPRREDEKRESDLDHQCRRRQGGEHAVRQLRGIPGEWSRQRLRPEVIVEGREPAPRRIA